jgi:hypothetical protein
MRIRISEREPNREIRDPREAFWASIREQNESLSNQRPAKLEAGLCREFGVQLRTALVEHLSKPLRALDSELFSGRLRDLEEFFMHLGGPEREWYRYQTGDVLAKFFQYRQELLQNSPALRQAQERLAAASGIVFSTRIVGYSSLSLDLSTGSFEQLAKVFDAHFDSFRVFLDAFVPVAFAGTFDQDTADKYAFEVTIPQSVEEAFNQAAQRLDSTRPAIPPGAGAVVAGPAAQSSARERAEWLWRLANGSLLIPVLITILLAFYGLQLLSDIRKSQQEALQPILQHQLELLREDRTRLSIPCGPGTEKTNEPSEQAPTSKEAKKSSSKLQP